MREQLPSELSHDKQSLSSPSPDRLRCWRLFFESSLALGDVLDTELEQAAGIPQRWYDVLVHLEESPGGLRMNELAEQPIEHVIAPTLGRDPTGFLQQLQML